MSEQQPGEEPVDDADGVEPEVESGAGYGNHAPEPGPSDAQPDET